MTMTNKFKLSQISTNNTASSVSPPFHLPEGRKKHLAPTPYIAEAPTSKSWIRQWCVMSYVHELRCSIMQALQARANLDNFIKKRRKKTHLSQVRL